MTTDFRELAGARFLPGGDMCLAHADQHGGDFEPVTRAFIFEMLAEPRGTFIDVGANTGAHAIPVALNGHRVVAFECNPLVLERLHENIALNGLTGQLEVIEQAASSKVGAANLYYNPHVRLTSGGSIACPAVGATARKTVPTTTIDEHHFHRVDVIKIDVEGHELAVLEGACETIRRHRPHLILEANTQELHNRLGELLEALKYRHEMVDARNIIASPIV